MEFGEDLNPNPEVDKNFDDRAPLDKISEENAELKVILTKAADIRGRIQDRLLKVQALAVNPRDRKYLAAQAVSWTADFNSIAKGLKDISQSMLD